MVSHVAPMSSLECNGQTSLLAIAPPNSLILSHIVLTVLDDNVRVTTPSHIEVRCVGHLARDRRRVILTATSSSLQPPPPKPMFSYNEAFDLKSGVIK